MQHPALENTRQWVQDVIIGLNLCPFAAAPFNDDAIRFALSRAQDPYEILAELLDLCTQLDETSTIATTLLVIPHMLTDWDTYLDLFHAARDLLETKDVAERVQIVSFHPHYCFDGADPSDPANLTNRSPHPTIHILRRDAVANAIATHPDTEAIPQRNITLLRSLDSQQIQRLTVHSYQESTE